MSKPTAFTKSLETLFESAASAMPVFDDNETLVVKLQNRAPFVGPEDAHLFVTGVYGLIAFIDMPDTERETLLELFQTVLPQMYEEDRMDVVEDNPETISNHASLAELMTISVIQRHEPAPAAIRDAIGECRKMVIAASGRDPLDITPPDRDSISDPRVISGPDFKGPKSLH